MDWIKLYMVIKSDEIFLAEGPSYQADIQLISEHVPSGCIKTYYFLPAPNSKDFILTSQYNSTFLGMKLNVDFFAL